MKNNLHEVKSGKLRCDNCMVYTEFEINCEELTRAGRFCVIRYSFNYKTYLDYLLFYL